jgi:hypothetical protein
VQAHKSALMDLKYANHNVDGVNRKFDLEQIDLAI